MSHIDRREELSIQKKVLGPEGKSAQINQKWLHQRDHILEEDLQSDVSEEVQQKVEGVH